MDGKACTKCKVVKPFTEFPLNKRMKDGYNCWCKACLKAQRDTDAAKKRQQAYMKAYYAEHKDDPEFQAKRRKYAEEHREQIRAQNKAWYEAHKDDPDFKAKRKKYVEEHREQIREYYASWRAEHEEELKAYWQEYYQQNKDQRIAYQRQYREDNPEKIAERADRYKDRKNARRIENVKLYLEDRITFAIWTAIHKGTESHWFDVLPFTREELLKHLESQFTPEMTWKNHGEYWEVDHIIPKKIFNYESENDFEFLVCWSLDNLRPLEISENRQRPRDGSDIPQEIQNKIRNSVTAEEE